MKRVLFFAFLLCTLSSGCRWVAEYAVAPQPVADAASVDLGVAPVDMALMDGSADVAAQDAPLHQPDLVVDTAIVGADLVVDTQTDDSVVPTLACTSDIECPAEQPFCQLPTGCLGQGSCVALPSGCFATYEPVCGCDGTTYTNSCKAAALSVNVGFELDCLDCPAVKAQYEALFQQARSCNTDTDCDAGLVNAGCYACSVWVNSTAPVYGQLVALWQQLVDNGCDLGPECMVPCFPLRSGVCSAGVCVDVP